LISIYQKFVKKKPACQLNVLKRIGRYLNKLGRLTIYYSFILSNFNYCPVTWHFGSEKNTKKMEKIQERALRFIYNDYVLHVKQFVLLCFVYLVLYSFNITLSWSAIMLLDSVLINFIWNCIYVWMCLLLCMSMYTWAYVLCF
jgi:hypothetical protein